MNINMARHRQTADTQEKVAKTIRKLHTHTRVMSVKNISVCLQYQPQMQLAEHHSPCENNNLSDCESLQ